MNEQENSLQSLLTSIKRERMEAKKPFAAMLIDELAQPPSEDFLAGITDEMTTDDWRKHIANMARPRRDETNLQAGAKTIARQFVAGDKDAAKIVRDTIDGVPVQETKMDAQSAMLAGAAAGATAALLQRVEGRLLSLRRVDEPVTVESKAIEKP